MHNYPSFSCASNTSFVLSNSSRREFVPFPENSANSLNQTCQRPKIRPYEYQTLKLWPTAMSSTSRMGCHFLDFPALFFLRLHKIYILEPPLQDCTVTAFIYRAPAVHPAAGISPVWPGRFCPALPVHATAGAEKSARSGYCFRANRAQSWTSPGQPQPQAKSLATAGQRCTFLAGPYNLGRRMREGIKGRIDPEEKDGMEWRVKRVASAVWRKVNWFDSEKNFKGRSEKWDEGKVEEEKKTRKKPWKFLTSRQKDRERDDHPGWMDGPGSRRRGECVSVAGNSV